MTHDVPGGVRFRTAEPGDAPAVASLHAASWRRHYRGAYSDAYLDGDVPADRLAVWTERLGTADPSRRTTLAEDGDGLVGFVHVVLDADDEWGSLLDNLHVDRSRQRHGLGSRLMAEAARAVTAGARHPAMYLWVLEQNTAAQAFYDDRGGRRADRHPVPAPGGVAERLNGEPFALRYVWPDPSVLLA